MSFGHFEPFPTPDPIDALDVDLPAFVDKQLTDATIAIPAVRRSQADDRCRQPCFVIADLRLPPLRRTRLPDDMARATLRDRQLRAYVLNARSLAERAQYFPDRASFRMSLSSVSSDTAFFNRSFSRSSSFNRLA